MQALRLTEQGLRLESIPDRGDPSAEICIRVHSAGLCETDLQLAAGYMNFRGTLGHEFVGTALEGKYQGQRVTGEINCPCGVCDLCNAGLGNHCPHRSVLGILNRDGAFAKYVTLPEANLHPVPDSLTDEEAVFIEPVAAACQILKQIPIDDGTRIVILGDGRLGTLCAQVLMSAGASVVVVGKHEEKLARIQQFDLETMLLSDAKRDRSADVVVDCTGSSTGVPTALQFVKPTGTIVLKTTVAGEQTLSLAPFVIDEVQLVGSRCGPFDVAIEHLVSGAVHVRQLITDRVPLSEAVAAFHAAQNGSGFKTIFDCMSP